MSYGEKAATIYGTPPTRYKAGRRCEKCGAVCSRYQGPCRDVGVSALLCESCQRERLELNVPLERFVAARRTGRGNRPGIKLPGLKAARKEAGLTCGQLAALVDMSSSYLWDLEGLRRGTSKERVLRIADALCVEVKVLS